LSSAFLQDGAESRIGVRHAQRNSADRTANVVIRGHAFIQNLRRGHYELGVEALPGMIVAAAFDELEQAV
jgi:hypothetical protein